jgi:hypothetical protein
LCSTDSRWVPKPNLQTTKIPPPQQASNQTTTKSQNYATATNLNLVLITEMGKKKGGKEDRNFFKKKMDCTNCETHKRWNVA